MIQLLYLALLTSDQRSAALITAGLFGFAEGIALLFIGQNGWAAYFLGSVGMLSLGWALACVWHKPDRFRPSLPPYPDLLVYGAVLSATLRPAICVLPGAIPKGLMLPRIDLELLIFGVLVVMIAISFPSLNDVHCKRLPETERPRPPEYLKLIPFGHRRTATAVMAVLVLAILAITFLAISEGPLVSFMTIFAFGSLLPWVFEHGYGSRSYIMRIFSPTLFATAALALILRTSYGLLIPLVAMKIGIGEVVGALSGACSSKG